MTCQFACVTSECLGEDWPFIHVVLRLNLPGDCQGARDSDPSESWEQGFRMSRQALVRKVHTFAESDFKGLWSSIRGLVVIETLDDGGKPQGAALLRIDQLYKADGDGGFAKATYLGCSDEYYQWWVDNQMGANVFHHFCRASSLA